MSPVGVKPTIVGGPLESTRCRNVLVWDDELEYTREIFNSEDGDSFEDHGATLHHPTLLLAPHYPPLPSSAQLLKAKTADGRPGLPFKAVGGFPRFHSTDIILRGVF